VQFLKSESGATAIEYSLIAGMMAIGLLAAFPVLSSGLQTSFTTLAAALGAVP